MKSTSIEVKSTYDLYRQLGLPVDLIEPTIGFTILNLKDVGFKLPYQSPSFRPSFFSFLFIKNGIGEYTIDEFKFHTEPNSIYFTNPGNYRTFAWSKIEEVYLITVDELFLKENINKEIFNDFPFLLTEIVRPRGVVDGFYAEIEPVYLQIHKEYSHDAPNKIKIIGHLLAVLLYKIKEYFWTDYDPICEGNQSSRIVKLFKQLLEKHYRDLTDKKVQTVFRVQDYADAIHLHPNYLSNVIKIKTGKTISSWITEKTIFEAKLLLQHTAMPIKEIMSLLGFSEAAHFSNYFKKHTNISPGRFRKEVENKI